MAAPFITVMAVLAKATCSYVPQWNGHPVNIRLPNFSNTLQLVHVVSGNHIAHHYEDRICHLGFHIMNWCPVMQQGG